MQVRKFITIVEETRRDFGRAVEGPNLKCLSAAVLANPLAGQPDADLEPLKDIGAEIAAILVARGLAALNAGPDDVESYGKGAIIGINGEIEHAAAVLHPRFGAPVRGALGKASEIIPSTKKMGGPGASITVPLTGKQSIWEFDLMDAGEISFADAPHPDEMVVILALGIGGRPRKRTRPDG